VANLEKRGHEVKISSLKRYIEALGDKLSLDVLGGQIKIPSRKLFF
jgi:hypothetical protein